MQHLVQRETVLFAPDKPHGSTHLHNNDSLSRLTAKHKHQAHARVPALGSGEADSDTDHSDTTEYCTAFDTTTNTLTNPALDAAAAALMMLAAPTTASVITHRRSRDDQPLQRSVRARTTSKTSERKALAPWSSSDSGSPDHACLDLAMTASFSALLGNDLADVLGDVFAPACVS